MSLYLIKTMTFSYHIAQSFGEKFV